MFLILDATTTISIMGCQNFRPPFEPQTAVIFSRCLQRPIFHNDRRPLLTHEDIVMSLVQIVTFCAASLSVHAMSEAEIVRLGSDNPS